jgi:Protein of unknown function (DUF3568)
MLKKISAVLVGAILVAVVGCVSTVNERSTAGVPFVKDKVEGRYERPVDECFEAAKDVVHKMGTLVNEETLYGSTNTVPVKTVQGKINQRNVWVRVEPVDTLVTSVTVQTRTSGGGSDIALAHEVEKRIALKLVK